MSYPFIYRTPGVGRLAEEVDDERSAQIKKWGDQKHPDGTGGQFRAQMADLARTNCQQADLEGSVTWNLILSEEVMEAFAETDPAKLRAELVQCAAVIFAWVSDIDRRPGGKQAGL
jgi:hypothetical protein